MRKIEGTVYNSFYFACSLSYDEEDRSPLPKQDTTEEKETQNLVYQVANSGIGKTFSQAEVSGFGRKSGFGEESEDDRCSSQNVVPKSKDEMEVN